MCSVTHPFGDEGDRNGTRHTQPLQVKYSTQSHQLQLLTESLLTRQGRDLFSQLLIPAAVLGTICVYHSLTSYCDGFITASPVTGLCASVPSDQLCRNNGFRHPQLISPVLLLSSCPQQCPHLGPSEGRESMFEASPLRCSQLPSTLHLFASMPVLTQFTLCCMLRVQKDRALHFNLQYTEFLI